MPPPKAPNEPRGATPTTVYPTRTGRKTTADKPLLAFSKHKSDHIIGIGIRTDVKNLESAKKLLAIHGLTTPSTGITFEVLADCLFEFTLTANLGATHTDILRAFAIIIDDTNQTEQVSSFMHKLATALNNPIKLLETRVEELGECITQHKQNLDCAVIEVRSQLHDSSEHIGKVVEDTIRATREQGSADKATESRSEGPLNYANAVRTGIPAPLTKILA
ncbi:hypothetical protein EDB19DRAFT_1904179 [Suillus lakei]|nr:hypothetical protein EDB19DRAFT_1904179 [Suillus lakei]